jgi:signal peptidase I
MRIEKDKYWHNSFEIYGGRSSGVGRNLMRELVEMIAFSVFLYLLVRAALPSFWVEGESMLPTLYSQERVLVNEALYYRYDANFLARLASSNAPADMRYLFHGPQRGDIVVFEAPPEARVDRSDFIKRVIAVEGETVEIKPDNDPVGDPSHDCGGCGVYVNGIKLNESYVKATPNYSLLPTVVPQGHVFVLGDNRRNSSDSHIWGPLAVERIVGTAFVSFWPQEHFGLLPHPIYAEMEKGK